MYARRVLLALLVAQVGLAVARIGMFFAELSERAEPRAGPGAGSALLVVLGILAVAALHASPRRLPGSFAAAGIAATAGLALAHTLAGMATGRLAPWVTPAAFAALAAGAFATRRRGAEPLAPALADLVSAALLGALAAVVPFPYVHFDTVATWACRSSAFLASGSFADVRLCHHPGYPPLYSVLLWLGDRDPLLGGRVLVLLLVVLFALFLRVRLARLSAELAAPSLLFLLATVNVWRGAATWYADVPLMALVTTGVLLALGGPAEPSRTELAGAALCLSAAALTRPDGLYAAAAALAGVLAARRRVAPRALAPFAAAAAAAVAWALRPASWRGGVSFFVPGGDDWRSGGAGVLASLGATLWTFLDGAFAQWLTHNGLGVALYALAAVALLRRAAPRSSGDARVYGAVTLAGLASVALCYAAVPFLGEPEISARPGQFTFLERYLRFIWVGMGRLTIHLLPFGALYGAAALRDAEREKETAAAGAHESERAPVPPRFLRDSA